MEAVEKSKIQIVVSGSSIQGYDTIAEIISKALEENGITSDVEHQMDDCRCFSTAPITYLAERIHVKIATKQINRVAVYNV